jgi:hypothetical protein
MASPDMDPDTISHIDHALLIATDPTVQPFSLLKNMEAQKALNQINTMSGNPPSRLDQTP